MKRIQTPLTDEVIQSLRAGEQVLISGEIYSARDAAHKRMAEAIAQGQPLPFDVQGKIIYYAGPTPAKPGQVIGSCGPTTSGRMDAYTPTLLRLGLKATIGKGERSPEVIAAMKECSCVYFASVGGAAALIAQSIKECEVVAYPELGPEAVRRMVVEDYPCVVAVDCYGGDVYEEGVKRYRAE